jgi:hypothetical protein
MKLFEISTEPTKLDRAIEFYHTQIKPNCGEYLSLVGNHDVYRGMSDNHDMFGTYHTHVDRRPMSISKTWHDMFNEIFNEITGINIRSHHALFTTSNYHEALDYANEENQVYTIFVPHKVIYTYVNGIRDLYQLERISAAEYLIPPDLDIGYEELKLIMQQEDPEFMPVIKKVVKYTMRHKFRVAHNSNILHAFDKEYEIIFTTPTYYAIQKDIWDKIKDKVV